MCRNGSDEDKTQAFVPITPGTRISHYTLISKIAAGGMGEVHLAEDNLLKRKVALKFLPQHLATDNSLKTRFFREARLAASLNHPNVITIHEVAEADGRIFIVMEYVDGKPVDSLIASGILTLDEIFSISLQACDGLQQAHNAGLIHRDIKPSNITVDNSGRVRILDFGLARIRDDARLTQTGATMGTVNYMSPEQSQGSDVDHRSDIFSLGAVIHEMSAGVPPFKRSNFAATINAICREQHEPISNYSEGFPAELQRVIDRALAKLPAERYQHVGDLATDLRRCQEARTAAHVPPTSGRAVTQPRARSLAVLYLRNLGAADDEHLSYGVTEDLIVDLSRIGSVRVAPMRSILKYKKSDSDLEEIADGLNVSMILDGSITRSEGGIRVAAQLLDVNSGETLWADRWEESHDQLPQIKQALAKEVAGALEINPDVTEKAQVGMPETQDAKAYECYLRGKYTFIQKKSPADVDVALGLYRQALAEEPTLIAARVGIAEIYVYRGEWSKAYEEMEAALVEARDEGHRAEEAALLRLKSSSLLNQSQWDEALEYGSESIAISRELGDLAGEAETLGIQIDILRRRARFDEALELFERVLELNRQLNDQQSAAEALKNMGTVNLRKGEYDLARSLYEESLHMARKQGNTSLEADCMGNTGLTYFHTGDFLEAMRFYEMALEIHSGLGDKGKEALWENNIAAVHESRGEFRKALAAYDRASEIHRQSGDRSKYALTRSNCAAMLAIVGEHDRCIQAASEAIEIAEELDFPMIISATNDSLGLTYLSMTDHVKAREHYHIALEIADKAGLRLNAAYAHCNLAELEYFAGEYPRCKEYCKEALASAKEIGLREVQMKAASYSAALMVRDGLSGAGVKQLRVIHGEAKEHGDPRYILLTMRLLGQSLIEFGRSSSDHDEGRKLLLEALEVARGKEISYESKWLGEILG